MTTTPAPAPWSFSIRTRIAALVVVCVLPASAFAGFLAALSHDRGRAEVEQVLTAAAQNLTFVVERDLGAVEAALLALSTSPSIDAGNLAALDRQARDVLAQSPGINLLHIDLNGQQLVNTARPFGTPLPRETLSPAMLAVRDTARPGVTNLFYGPVLKMNVVALAVPVLRDGRVVSFLAMSLDAKHLDAVLARHTLPAGWTVEVLDGAGTVVTRGGAAAGATGVGDGPHDEPRILAAAARQSRGVILHDGRHGQTELVAYNRSAELGWTVVVEVPEHLLNADLARSLWLNLTVGAVLLLVGLVLARRIGRDISRPIEALIQPALALGRGEPVAVPPLGLREADRVGQAMTVAGELLRQREHERDRAQMEAWTDALTGLDNRRHFDGVLMAEIRRLRRSRAPLALIMLDIDHFKAFNDGYGHVAGDECLRMVAGVVAAMVQRPFDLAARYGGEEFAVILPETDLPGAATVAERLREAVSALRIPHRASETGRVTVSLGVVCVTVEADTVPEEVVARADEQLYRAKSLGRNRVAFTVPTGPVPVGLAQDLD
ncbi:sensor domain-containing diguanylate cyclase [Azospirillum sp. TSO35-2]|uniref:sensor domain-containing diguanylate cyclase n=1 Tax=Azospirillum sp. TSO35-2 TaxID=716796 RepID=UPI000D60DD78|nr:sensor domain-containing diguanylate cyclase [Azospirillum sp. TSO35-2]PWC32826.1 hypothetical protein TSO352_19675 [Azospirillum sp. TSO35-2]